MKKTPISEILENKDNWFSRILSDNSETHLSLDKMTDTPTSLDNSSAVKDPLSST